jgi:hypothetical protein
MAGNQGSVIEFLQGLGLAIIDPERVLICTQESCQYALQVTNKCVSQHMRQKHHVPKAQRRGLDEVITSLQLANPRDVPPLPDGAAVHPLLKKWAGYACRRCAYRTTSSKLIQQHLFKSPSCSDPQMWESRESLVDEVWLQSWVQEGVRHYWIAQDEPKSASSPVKGTGPTQTEPSRLESILETERHRISGHRHQQNIEDMTIENAPADNAVSPWLHRTLWHQTYSRARRDILVKMTLLTTHNSRRSGRYLGTHNSHDFRTSAHQEQRIGHVMRAIERLFLRCEETVKHTARPILCWLYSQHPLMSSRRAFRLVDRPTSRDKYTRVIKKCFTFLILAYLIGPKKYGLWNSG